MPDNWGYVFSAYGLAAVVLLGYWRLLRPRALRWPQPPPAIIYAALTLAAVFTLIRNLPPHSF